MAKIKLTRRYWLGELKRAELEKPNYLANMMKQNFSGINAKDPDAVLSAQRFCEQQYLHFIKSLETWINDNYPAKGKPAEELDLFAELRTVNDALKQAFPGMTMHVVGVDPGTIHF